MSNSANSCQGRQQDLSLVEPFLQFGCLDKRKGYYETSFHPVVKVVAANSDQDTSDPISPTHILCDTGEVQQA